MARSSDRLEQVAGDHREHHVELEAARGAGERDRRVVADHLGADLEGGLGDHRVDLAGHDARPGLEVLQVDLGEPGRRAAAHPAQVVADLDQARRRTSCSAPLSSTSESWVPCASKWFARLGELAAGVVVQVARSPCSAKPAGVLMPVPTAVPPSGQLADPRERRRRSASGRARRCGRSRRAPGRG